MKLPSGFLHWFVALGGVLLVIRAVWPWADRAIQTAARTPTGRLISMDEVTEAAVFLLENRAVNGVNLAVDGGWMML